MMDWITLENHLYRRRDKLEQYILCLLLENKR